MAMPFDQFLFELGNLHDCSVTAFLWRPFDETMTFEIRDIYWNYEGMPEYKGRGPSPGEIKLLGVKRPRIDLVQVTGPLRISDFELLAHAPDGSGTASITFWDGGKIEAAYGQAIFPDMPSLFPEDHVGHLWALAASTVKQAPRGGIWNAVIWWELRRIPFNAALLVAGILSVTALLWISAKLAPPGQDIIEPPALALDIFLMGLRPMHSIRLAGSASFS